MRVAFPYPVRLQSSIPRLEGLRLGTFTNIDNESFARPSLNGFWRLDMTVVAVDWKAQVALRRFVTAMSGNARCVVPICLPWRTNNANGRRLARGGVAPEFTGDFVGFANEPFDGFTLRSPASHRDSYIDVNKPALSHLMAHITIAERLYEVVNVTPINESETSVRVSVMPPIRGNHDAGTVVIVDQLKLLCQMESGDQIGLDTDPIKTASFSFIEAFGEPALPSIVEPAPSPDEGMIFDFVAVYEAAKQ